ncbi:MAG: PA14 domain-containing protein [Candidatus Promineifilaceae bacterium]
MRSKPFYPILLISAPVLLALLLFAGPSSAQSITWQANYWNNVNWSGAPSYQRIEYQIPDYGWGDGSPAPGIQSDDFSARWITNAYFEPGKYRFSLRTDDGARLWVNNQEVLDIDITGEVFTADVDIAQAGSVPIRLDFWENKGNAGVHLSWERRGNVSTAGPIRAEYYNNKDLAGSPILVRNEGPGLYHNWGNGSPAPGIVNSDKFSARYTQAMNVAPGRYRFTAKADDGIRFWINGYLLIDKWYDSTLDPVTVDVDLPGGILNFMVHYYDNVGGAVVSLTMTQLSSSGGYYPGSGGSDGYYPGSGGSGNYIPGTGGGSLTSTSTYGVVNTTALNMRSGPGTEYEVVQTLVKGEPVQLTGAYNGYWVQVTTRGNITGWVNSSYLDYNLPVG